MTSRVETLTPPNTPTPIGPYNHVAKEPGCTLSAASNSGAASRQTSIGCGIISRPTQKAGLTW